MQGARRSDHTVVASSTCVLVSSRLRVQAVPVQGSLWTPFVWAFDVASSLEVVARTALLWLQFAQHLAVSGVSALLERMPP